MRFHRLSAAILLVSLCLPLLAAEQDEPQSAEAIFTYVRDSTAFDIYSGSIASPAAITSLKSGNSLDRALLLYTMLRDAGFRPALIQGVLRRDALPGILSHVFQVSEESIVAQLEAGDPVLTKAGELLRDHFWVRVGELNLDPTLPTATPGSSLGFFRKELKRLPSDMYQRLELEIEAHFTVRGSPVRSRLSRYIGTLGEIRGRDITLFWVNKEIDESFTMTDTLPIYPVLSVDGEIQPAINLKEERARISNNQNNGSPEIRIEEVWLTVIYKAPGKEDERIHRLLHHRSAPEQSLLNGFTVISVNGYESIPADLAAQCRALAATIDPEWQPRFTSVLSDLEKTRLATRVNGSLALAAHLSRSLSIGIRQIDDALADDYHYTPAGFSPLITAVYVKPQSGEVETDIISYRNHSFSPAAPAVQWKAHNLLAGALATGLESWLLNTVLPGNTAYSALDLSAASENSSWHTVQGFTRQPPASILRSPTISRMFIEAQRQDRVLLVPVDQGGGAAPGFWWELDSTTGTMVGMLSPGIGGGRWQDISTAARQHHRPSLKEGWSVQLEQLLNSAGGWEMARILNACRSILGERTGETALMMYNLLSHEDIAGQLPEFASPLFRIQLLRYQGQAAGNGQESTGP